MTWWWGRRHDTMRKLAHRPKPRSKEDGDGLAEAKEALRMAQEARDACAPLAAEAEEQAATWRQIRADNGFTRAVRELFGS